MKRMLGVGLLALSLVAVGCGDAEDIQESAIDEDVEDRTPYEQLNTTADSSEGYATGAPAPVTPVQGEEGPADVTPGAPLTATGNLVGVAENAPPGTVTVTDYGPGTQVLVKIDRYTTGTTLVATLTQGACAQPGQIVTRIGEPFTVGPQGFATLTARIPQQTRTILNGRYSVRINTPGRDAPEFVLACANLPALER